MQYGFICGDCVKLTIDQMARAKQRDEGLDRVRGCVSHLLQLVVPTGPRWLAEWEVSALNVLAKQLSDLASAYAYRRAPFAVEVDLGERLDEAAGRSTDTDVAEPSTTFLRLVGPPAEPSAPAMLRGLVGDTPEVIILTVVSDLLSAELLDWPTPNMAQILDRHEVDGMNVKVGIQAMRDELRRQCDLLNPRPLTLVRGPDEVHVVHSGDAGVTLSWAERYAAPHPVTVPAESRCWIERLESWIRSVDLSPERLARRAKRERAAAVVSLFGQTDRQTSLRRFLDLVRSAGACLCGVPDATPTAVFRRLKEIVSKQGLSIATLAHRSGINRSQLSTLFRRTDPNPCLWTVQRIVAALNCDAEMMLVKAEDEVG